MLLSTRIFSPTSSHSAPNVSKAINVGDTLNRVAITAILSMNLSAPNSRTKSPLMKAAILKVTLSNSVIFIDVEMLIVRSLKKQL